jgi:hypothetical protein
MKRQRNTSPTSKERQYFFAPPDAKHNLRAIPKNMVTKKKSLTMHTDGLLRSQNLLEATRLMLMVGIIVYFPIYGLHQGLSVTDLMKFSIFLQTLVYACSFNH